MRFNASGHLSPRQRRRFTRDAAVAFVVAAMLAAYAFYYGRHPLEFRRYPSSPSSVAFDFWILLLIGLLPTCFSLMRAWDALSNTVAVVTAELQYASKIDAKGNVEHFLICGEQRLHMPGRCDAAFDPGLVYHLYYLDAATPLSVEPVSPDGERKAPG